MHNAFLIGSRVYLRPLERADAPCFTRYLNDPEVRKNLLRDWPISLTEEENWIANLADSRESVVLAICTREGDRLLGVLGLQHFDWCARHACFGIGIGEKDCWDQGYGTEASRLLVSHAFETLNLNRVWLHVFEYNARAAHVYEKLGFVQEGRLRQHLFREGRYWDVLVLGVLREQWSAQPA